jgi:cation transport ATPase
MAEEKKEKWLAILPATTVVIAVCATLSTFKGGGYSTKSMLSQSKASDQWAFYQAKSIKAYLSDMQKENLELNMKNQKDAEYSAELAKRIKSYEEKIKKYGDEKEQIAKTAKGFEEVQIESKKHSEAFGVAVIFLQIAILLSSIAALIKKSPLWYVGIIVAVIGIAYFFNGFFLFF